jgi:predicted DNA-binding transcriptional regulator YafY
MPVNRNALIRYRTIDNCLRNKYRKWTLEDLIEACSVALYEYEGIDKGVSRRSIQMDLQMMRSEKLGYHAPIVVMDKKYYAYEDPDYSISNIPLTDQDLGKLTEVVEILRQFKGFTHFQELTGMVQRLEDRIHTAKTKQAPIIDLEKNDGLKGLEFLDAIYQAILRKQALTLTYQSFKAREANTFTFHPYFLKEYRIRWFVLGTK